MLYLDSDYKIKANESILMNKALLTSTLQQIPVFEPIAARSFDMLATVAYPYELEIGDILYEQGTLAEEFYIVLEGGVRLSELTPEGKVVGLKMYGPGEFFGLLSISGSFPHPSRVDALQDSLVIGIPGDDMRQIIAEDGQLGLLVIDIMIEHVHQAHYRIREMASERVDQRLARTLLMLCKKFGHHNGPNKVCIDVPITQQDLAEFTGSAIETINRILKKWDQQEIIRLSRMRIEVLQPNILQSLLPD